MKTFWNAAGLLAACLMTTLSLAQQGQSGRDARSGSAMIGKMNQTEFENQNRQGLAAVSAIASTKNALSQGDNTLINEVAMGGMMQLEVSRVAVQKATSNQVRQLAQAEVDEQTGLAAKLKDIAAAKGVTLPTAPDPKTRELVTKMQSLSGKEFDRFYVSESGVKGHQKLDQVMLKVESTASDATLKGIASAAHPLVRTHLQVAQEVQAGIQNGGSN